ncbi:MAG: hypothetical protein U0232_05410 [Thermomicrobiales bacterium]
MSQPAWTLTDAERGTLAAALDALLPPEGSFPEPSQTGMIDDFILRRIPAPGAGEVPYPGIDGDGLRAIIARLAGGGDMAAALATLEREQPAEFLALWRLAVYGYYSRPETIAAVGRDHFAPYHGAPLPLGYAHAIEPWNRDDPLQNPQHQRGAFIPTEAVRRVELGALPGAEE